MGCGSSTPQLEGEAEPGSLRAGVGVAAPDAPQENASDSAAMAEPAGAAAAEPAGAAAAMAEPGAAAAEPGIGQGRPRGVTAAFLKTFAARVAATLPDASLQEKAAQLRTTDVCMRLVQPATLGSGRAYDAVIEREHPAALGPATLFVSHAWGSSFLGLCQALVELAAERQAADPQRPPDYFWVDLLFNDQNAAANLPQEWWTRRFRDSIAAVGRMVLVLSPWNQPLPLTRAWCLFELLQAVQLQAQGVGLEIRLSSAESAQLKSALIRDYDAVLSMLSSVQIENARAFKEEDRKMILAEVERSVGAATLNQRIKALMRDWAIERALAAVEEDGKAAGESAGALAYGRLCNQVAVMLEGLGRFDKALELAETGLKLRRQHYGPTTPHVDVAGSLSNVASVLRSKNNIAAAVALFKESKSTLEQVLGPAPHAEVAAALNNLGMAQAESGDADGAADAYTQALAIYDALDAAGTQEQQQPEMPHGHALVGMPMDAQATTSFGSGGTPGSRLLGRAAVYTNQGALAFDRGDLDAALALHGKALELKLRVLGDKHPSVGTCYHNLGTVWLEKSSDAAALSKARGYFEQDLAIGRAVLGSQHADVAAALDKLGLVLARQGEMGAAESMMRESLRVREAALGSSHVSVAYSCNSLATLLVKKKQPAAAVELLERSLAILEAGAGAGRDSSKPSAAVVGVLENLSAVHRLLGNIDKSMAFQARSMGLDISIFPDGAMGM